MTDVIADPELDPTATYAVDPTRARRLASRVVAGPAAEQHLSHTPMTGAPLASLPVSTPEDVAVAIGTARAAQRAWGRLNIVKYTESQNVTGQHLVGFGGLPGVPEEKYAQRMTFALNAMKRLGLK